MNHRPPQMRIFQTKEQRLFRLIPEDVLVHAFKMLDAANMSVNEADIRHIVVEAVDLAVGAVDVEESRIVPEFILDCIDGVASLGRILELAQRGRAASTIVAHRTGYTVRTREIVFDGALQNGADGMVVCRRITPTVFQRRRGGAEEALPFASVVVEGVFPPPQVGFRSAVEQRPAEVVVVVIAVHG